MPDFKNTILIVDDSKNILKMLDDILSIKNYKTYTSENIKNAIQILEKNEIDLVITDLRLKKSSGFDIVKLVKDNYKYTETIVITGYATIEKAVHALKLGADDFLEKPFKIEHILTIVKKAITKVNTRKKMREKRKTSLSNEDTYGLIGSSSIMTETRERIRKAASTPVNVLITGESGTGKELVAKAIHTESKRNKGPFIPVNCGAIPEELLESELFGHVKGAFTGASSSNPGFFQAAENGSIFLDEISNTSINMQGKLLRTIQNKEIYMVGSRNPQSIDTKIIAATNKKLNMLVDKGKFRQDLFFRLNVLNIDLSPLREKKEDIPELIEYFSSKFCSEYSIKPLKFSNEALKIFQSYSWPGNIRELENIIQRLAIFNENKIIKTSDLPESMHFYNPLNEDLSKTLEEIEIDHINKVLKKFNNNKTKAAESLGITRKTLRNKLK